MRPRQLFEPGQVKICPRCGTQSDSVDMLCGNCGEIIHEVVPSPARVNMPPRQPDAHGSAQVTVLESTPPRLCVVVGNQSFECKHGDVLGRSGTVACQVFTGIPTVGRRHVALELRARTWHLVNLPPQTAGPGRRVTELDGREMPAGTVIPLTGEHVLRLSSQCEVRLLVSNA